MSIYSPAAAAVDMVLVSASGDCDHQVLPKPQAWRNLYNLKIQIQWRPLLVGTANKEQ